MGRNRFDTFEKLLPADYLPRLQKVHAEMNRGYDRRDQMVEANDAQRVANAQKTERLVDQAYQLSPTIAKFFKDRSDRRDQQLKNEAIGWYYENEDVVAAQIAQEAGEGRSDDAQFDITKVAESIRNKDGATLQDQELANKLETMSGHQHRVIKQAWAKELAGTVVPDFQEKLAKGELNHLRLDDGTTFNNSSSITTDRALFRGYLEDQGFNSTNWAHPDFWVGTIKPILQKGEKQWLNTRASTRNTQHKNEQIQTAQSSLRSAIVNTPEQAGETYMSLIRNYSHVLGGTPKAAAANLNAYILKQVEQGKIDPAVARALPTATFPHKGKGGKRTSLEDNYPEVFEGFDNALNESITESATIRDNVTKAKQTEFDGIIARELAEMKTPVTYQWKMEKVQAWFAANPNTALPPKLKALLTKEPGDDTLLDLQLQAKRAKRLPITIDEIHGFSNTTLFNKWKGLLDDGELGGVSSDISAKAKVAINAAIGGRFEDQINDRVKRTPWVILEENASSLFEHEYTKALKQEESPDAAYRTAIEKVEAAISDPTWGNKRGMVDPKQEHETNLSKAHQAIADDVNIITSGIIPGTEKAFQEVLTSMEKPPYKVTVPHIYKQIAATQLHYTALDILNFQLQSQGKPTVSGMKVIDYREKATEQGPQNTSGFPDGLSTNLAFYNPTAADYKNITEPKDWSIPNYA